MLPVLGCSCTYIIRNVLFQLLLKAGRGIKVSFEKDLPATIKRVNRAALDAGLLEGDVILEMNRRDVSNCSGDVILDYMW